MAPGTLPRSLPEAHENAVLVFLLTPGLLADSAVRAYAALATGSRFPILTVSATLHSFDFSTLKDEFRLAPQAPAWEQTWSRRKRDLTLQRRLSASVG